MPANPNHTDPTRQIRSAASRAGMLLGLGGDSHRRLYLRIASEDDTPARRTLRRHVGRHRRHILHRNAFTLLAAAHAGTAGLRLRGIPRTVAVLTATAAAAGAITSRRHADKAETRYGELLDAIDREQLLSRQRHADRSNLTA